MIINHPEIKHTLDEYDIMFASGALIPLIIDRESGDTISFEDKAIVISILPKPSLTDPKVFTQGRDLTIFTTHLAAVEHRVRVQIDPSPEQKFQLHQTLQELSKQVH